MIHDATVKSPCDAVEPQILDTAQNGALTMVIRMYKMACCHAVIVDRLTVESPVTVIAE